MADDGIGGGAATRLSQASKRRLQLQGADDRGAVSFDVLAPVRRTK